MIKTKSIAETLFFLLLIGLASPTWARSDSAELEKKLEKIRNLQTELSQTYPITLSLGEKEYAEELPLWQTVEIHQCEMRLRLKSEAGVIFQDFVDLTEFRPQRKWMEIQGAKAITFGFPNRAKIRAFLLFDDSSEGHSARRKTLSLFDDLGDECRKNKIENHLGTLPPPPWKNQKLSYAGKIPTYNQEDLQKVQNSLYQNKATLLKGEAGFLERYRSLSAAKKSIYLQYLAFRADFAGQFMAKALIQKRAEGLDIKINVDGLSGMSSTRGKILKENTMIMYNNLMAAGIRVFGYSCKEKIMRNEFQGLDLFKIIRRNHEKLWIVDGELAGQAPTSMAIVGGLNISQDYFRMVPEGPHRWRDQDIAVKGPVVKDFYQGFVRGLQLKAIRYKTYHLDKTCLNPYHPLQEKSLYDDFKARHSENYRPYEGEDLEIYQYGEAKLSEFLQGNLGERDSRGRPVPTQITYSPAQKVHFVHDRPDEQEISILKTQLDLIRSAKKEVLISNAYFVPDRDVIQAVNEAAQRGVKIKILTNTPQTNDLPIMTIVGRYYYQDLVGAYPQQVEIFEWQGKPSPFSPESKQQEGTYHCKFLVVDGEVGLVGTYNLNNSSKKNTEAALVFEDLQLGRELKQLFLEDLTLAAPISSSQMEFFKNPEGDSKYERELKKGLLIESFL